MLVVTREHIVFKKKKVKTILDKCDSRGSKGFMAGPNEATALSGKAAWGSDIKLDPEV